MNDETIERLELKIAYLEKANQELSDVVFAQQQALDALAARVDRLAGRIEGIENPAPAYSAADEKPPHY